MRFTLVLLLALCIDQWVVDNYEPGAHQEIAMIYFMYHPESDSLWTETTERGRDLALQADPNVVELDEADYQAKQAELTGR